MVGGFDEAFSSAVNVHVLHPMASFFFFFFPLFFSDAACSVCVP